MYLRAISIRGFKSFPDPIEVRLEPGVAVVVGPNGSGKSNIADALLWASGSLAPSELRAEKPDDVLFGGTAARPAAPFCEVELRFEDVDGGALGVEELFLERLHHGRCHSFDPVLEHKRSDRSLRKGGDDVVAPS